MAMISCHGNFSNEGPVTSERGKVAPTEKALSWLLEKMVATKIPVAK